MSKFQKPRATEALPQNEKKVAAVIERGGHVPNENTTDDDLKLVQLRLMPDVVTEIDGTRSSRRPKPSRHSWLLEAIYEKLEREQKT